MNSTTGSSEYTGPGATAEQQQALREDVANVLAMRDHIIKQTANTFDPTRILGIISVAKGADQYLPYTLPALLRQVARAGRHADMVIGLNDGYECSDILAGFAVLPDVEITHLYTGDKLAGNIPAPIFDHPDRSSAGYRIPQESPHHRIFVLHQKPGPYTAGKTRMLQDMCDSLVLGSIERGWIPPKYVLMFDRETLILQERAEDDIQPYLERVSLLMKQTDRPQELVQRLIAENSSASRPRSSSRELSPTTIDLDSPGLELLIDTLDKDTADIVGVSWRNCVYDIKTTYNGMNVLMPNLAAPVSVLHQAGYAAIGLTPQTMLLSGCCVIGKLEALLSMYISMCKIYPGLVGEDAMASVLGYHAGFNTVFQRGLYATNRCPALHEMAPASSIPAWKEQYARWTAVVDTIERLYGYENITPIRGTDERMSLAVAMALFAKTLRQTNDLARSFGLLQELNACQADLEEIRQLAKTRIYMMNEDHTFTAW